MMRVFLLLLASALTGLLAAQPGPEGVVIKGAFDLVTTDDGGEA